ncbi:P-loop NTPase fold protein [Flagellimonas hymeniacidonis]|nr:P-loop NTPase fold protein [Flagellimonas hymeniacidonis]
MKYPIFLKTSPEGEDLFKGKSQEKIAGIIEEVIENQSFENHVIGLEGQWGSGKSNTIDILKRKFDTKEKPYHFFTYDTWGHQEDLTRRSFLEEILHELLSKKLLVNVDKKWENLEAQLLAKKSTKHTSKFPQIKRFWVLFTTSFLLFTILSTVIDDLVQASYISSSSFWIFLLKYLPPAIFLFFAFRDFWIEFRQMKPEDVGFDKNYDLSGWEKIGFLTFWFSGKDVTSREVENIIEEEPSVKKFKEYFQQIVGDLDTSKISGLVLIFDNMDRLSSFEKVMSLWSSIHTFFAECKYSKVWVLIPYDRTHLANFFDRQSPEKGRLIAHEFISKTFSTSFRISPPVISDWKGFFREKMSIAFGKDFFKNKKVVDEAYFIETIFDYSYPKSVNPRQIISYINSIVGLYKQWNNSIPIRYLALFTIKKHKILDSPIETISNRSYLGNLSGLFLEDNKLEQYMSALVFNVNLEKANEVLLKPEIEQIMVNANLDGLTEIKKHPQFLSYFDMVIKERVNSDSIILENISNVLVSCKDILNTSVYHNYWRRINNELDIKITNRKQYHEEFSNIHKLSLTESKFPNGKPKTILKQLIESCKKSVYQDDSKKVTSDYYTFLSSIQEFLQNEKIEIGITEIVPYCTADGNNYVKIIEEARENIAEYKILVTEKDICNYLIENDYGLTEVEKDSSQRYLLEIILEVNKASKLSMFKKHIETELDKVTYDQSEALGNLIIANRILMSDDKKPLKKKLSFETARGHFINEEPDEEAEYFYDLIATLIAYQTNKKYEGEEFIEILQKEREIDLIRLSSIIEYYISYGDLLKMCIHGDDYYELIADVAKHITNKSYGTSRLLASWVFKNWDDIQSTIFDGEFENFMRRFDRWEKHFSDDINVDNVVDSVDLALFTEIDIKEQQQYKSLKFVCDLTVKRFENFSTTEWASIFDKKNKEEKFFKHLYVKGKISNRILKSSDFNTAYENHMYKIISGEVENYDSSFWKELVIKERLNVNSLKRIFNVILDKLLHFDHSIKIKELLFFKEGLLNYCSNFWKYSSEVQRQILIPLLKNKKGFENFIIGNEDKIIRVFKASDEYIHDIKEAMKENLDTDIEAHNNSAKYIINNTKIGNLIKSDKKKESNEDDNEK